MATSSLNPSLMTPAHCRLAAGALIVGAAILRILYFLFNCPLDLAPDEAHYWDWSRHLDWSYYSKGPLVAYLIRASCWLFGPISEALTGNQMAAVRLPAVLFGGLLLVSLYVLTVQIYGNDKLALGVVAIALTLPVIAAGSTLMTIDSPYSCCWGWALVFGHCAVIGQRRWAWFAAGACIALGILAKYTMVLWAPSLGLFLLCTPTLRKELARSGFWIMACVGALGAIPILYWNVQHDWITLRHARGHAGMQSPSGLRWTGPLVFVGLQFALLLGYWFIAWAGAMCAHHPLREGRPAVRYLWFMSVPTFVFFWVFSLKNGGGEPNWPITAYLSGFVLAVAWLAEILRSRIAWLRISTRICIGGFAALGLLLTVVVHHGAIAQPLLARLAGPATAERPTPIRQFDPTCRLRGWRTLAAEVDRVRASLLAEGIEPILTGSAWGLPGEIGFYCAGQPQVFSVGLAMGDRHSQYDLWRPNPLEDPKQFLGRTFILIGGEGDAVRDAFDAVEPTRTVVYSEDDNPIARWTITICRGYKGLTPRGDRH